WSNATNTDIQQIVLNSHFPSSLSSWTSSCYDKLNLIEAPAVVQQGICCPLTPTSFFSTCHFMDEDNKNCLETEMGIGIGQINAVSGAQSNTLSGSICCSNPSTNQQCTSAAISMMNSTNGTVVSNSCP